MRTVAAVSTPYGKGGVALIRISGPDAIEIAQRVAHRANGVSLTESSSGQAVRVTFAEENGLPFDDGLATLFRAPRSFTGENVAELCCHGGILVTQKLLQAVFAAGAFAASAGEFTRRAFQNGKLSLSQAEAVGGLIDAKSERCLNVSLLQCQGALSEKLKTLCERLTHLLASVYAYIDYPDEDMTDVSVAQLREEIRSLQAEVQTLCDSHAYGKAISEGIRTVLLGKPNTGKSALLNALLGKERAIVTDIAGTTRDVLHEELRLGDLLLQMSDTAGLRESEDKIEQLGVARSLQALREAEAVFAVFDGSNPPDGQDLAVKEQILSAGKQSVTVWILNKADLGAPDPAWDGFLPERPLCLSALQKTGLDLLENAVKEKIGMIEPEAMGEIVLGARQYAALCKANRQLENALHTLDGFTQDLAGLDLEQALASLEEVDGKTASDEIVNEIFSHFCVGK